MKRLIPALVLVAAVGIALALTAGDGRSTGDADTPGPAVPDLSVARLDGSGDFALNGPAFVTRHRLRTPTILFDEPMTAWESYAIPGQPAGVLLDRDGRERGRWLGAFDPADVRAAARGL